MQHLANWHPVALTSFISKCFERHVKDHIYNTEVKIDEVISTTINSAFTHLQKKHEDATLGLQLSIQYYYSL